MPPPAPSTANPTPAGPVMPGRFGVGIIATACFALAGALYLVMPDDPLWWGGGIRMGLVSAALWFALPGGGRAAAWAGWDWKAVGFVALCLLLSVRAPQWGLPLLGAWWFWRWLKTPPAKAPRPAPPG